MSTSGVMVAARGMTSDEHRAGLLILANRNPDGTPLQRGLWTPALLQCAIRRHFPGVGLVRAYQAASELDSKRRAA